VRVTVDVKPPTEPHIELSVNGLKNFQATPGGFVAQLTVSELKQLWAAVTDKLQAAGIPVTERPLP
jgi:hypothetical protein